MSVSPVDLSIFGGTGLHTLFITLHGTQQTGSMSITFDPAATTANQFGTFSSSLPVSFDVRQDSLTGTILASGSDTLTASSTPWTHIAPPGAILINGINHLLNGTNDLNDFWPGTVLAPNGSTSVPFTEGPIEKHVVMTATPEPSSLVLGTLGALALLGSRRIRQKRAA